MKKVIAGLVYFGLVGGALAQGAYPSPTFGSANVVSGGSYKINGTNVVSASGTTTQLGSSGSTRIERKDISDTQGDTFTVLSKFSVETGPTWNAITGSIVQDGSNGNSYPTGVTGYAHLNNAGNTAFGVFGRCDASTVGNCVGAEFNTFNNSGAPNATFPLVLGFGIATNEHVPLQIVSFGTYASKAGLSLNSGVDGGGYGFVAGIYSNPLTASSYGVFMDANTSVGPQYAGQFNTTGAASTINLAMQMKNAPNASARYITGTDNGGHKIYEVDGAGTTTITNFTNTRALVAGVPDGFNGSINATGGGDLNLQISGTTKLDIGLNSIAPNGIPIKLAKVAVASLPTCNGTNEGYLMAVTDANSATFNATVAAGGANHVMAYCNGTGWTIH